MVHVTKHCVNTAIAALNTFPPSDVSRRESAPNLELNKGPEVGSSRAGDETLFSCAHVFLPMNSPPYIDVLKLEYI